MRYTLRPRAVMNPSTARLRQLLLPAVSALGISACGDAAPPVADAADLRHVEDAPRLALVEELRLGSFDDPEIGFTRIFQVAIDEMGRMYVGDGSDYEIRIYGPDGTPLGRFGGRGDGPGEFSSTPSFGVRAGRVWASDFRNGRVSLFSADGELLSSRVIRDGWIPARTGSLSMQPVGMDEEGLFVTWPKGVRYSGETGRDAPLPRIRIDAAGETVDTAGFLSGPPPRLVPPEGYESGFRAIEIGGSRYQVPQPPTRLPMWYGRVDGHLTLETPWPEGPEGTFTVSRVGLDGDTVFSHTFTYLTEPYTDRDLEEAARSNAERQNMFIGGMPAGAVGDSVDTRRVTERLLDEIDFPPFRPDIASAVDTPDGHLWVQRRGESGDETRGWVIISPDGRLRGRLELPATSRPRAADADHVWMTETDDFDVPWLVRYRIEG